MSDEQDHSALDPHAVQTELAELHAELLWIRDALVEGHEAKAAILLTEAIEDAQYVSNLAEGL